MGTNSRGTLLTQFYADTADYYETGRRDENEGEVCGYQVLIN
jgi:hypothetical protein